jgi:hypothetical protein
MPDALIVVQNKTSFHEDRKALNEMVDIGLVKCVSVKGVKVYGRHYLTNRAIRQAYKKKIGE